MSNLPLSRGQQLETTANTGCGATLHEVVAKDLLLRDGLAYH